MRASVLSHRQLVLLVSCVITAFLSDFARADCIPGPIAFPVGNVSLNTGLNRGIRLRIGTPARDFAFDADTLTNNTFVWATDSTCKDTSDASCNAQHGGDYDSKSSSSYVAAANVAAAGGNLQDSVDVTNASILRWANDNFDGLSGDQLVTVPFAIMNDTLPYFGSTYNPPAALGLSSNSTFINALKNAGKIGSHVWSFYYGLTGETEQTQLDGSLVVGGYDAAKVVAGKNQTFPYASVSGCRPSQPHVFISDLRVDLPDGSHVSLMQQQSAAIKACIDPSNPTLMSLPVQMYEAFEQTTGQWTAGRSPGVNFYDMQIDNTSTPIFQGGLTVVLDGGLEISVPNHQLVQPTWQVGTDGKLFANTTYKTLLIDSLQDTTNDQAANLGRNFFSSAYIMVNARQNTFTLWQANATADQRLVAVDDDGNEASTSCPQPGSTGTAASPPASSDTGAGASPGRLPLGAIVGLAAGLGVASVLVAVATILLLRRRARRRADTAWAAAAAAKHKPTVELADSDARLAEMYTSPPELYGKSWSELHGRSRSELSAYKPAELVDVHSQIERQELP